jgi:tetratricopeptide (TPR) repeat protein
MWTWGAWLQRLGLAVVTCAIWASLSAWAENPSADQVATWQALNQRVEEAYQAGRVSEAIPLAEQSLALAQRVFGAGDPHTLTSLNDLGVLLKAKLRYSEAEPLLREALQGRREVLGARHPDTVASLNDLTELLRDQARYKDDKARYGEAEPLFREALQGRLEVLGPRDPATFTSMVWLAEVLQAQRRYGEAEALLRKALQGAREELGPRDHVTSLSFVDLTALLDAQGRFDEARSLEREALEEQQGFGGAGCEDTPLWGQVCGGRGHAFLGPPPVPLQRTLLFPDTTEPKTRSRVDRAYQLYVYLLIEQAANKAKRDSALRAFACFVPPAGTSWSHGDNGIFLVPVTAHFPKAMATAAREKVRDKLIEDGSYDYQRAHEIMLKFSGLVGEPVDPVGIFMVELDAPINQPPHRGRAYNLGGLTNKEVGDWIVLERSNIEHGWSAGTPELARAKPSWVAVLSGLGETLQSILPAVFAPAQAETVRCE